MTNRARAARRVRGVFVAGSDTGVGKTIVSAGLLRLAAREGRPLLPWKPVESGCGGGPPRDASLLRAASGRLDLDIRAVCPHPLGPPVAPAAVPGFTIRLPSLVRAAAQFAGGSPLLVESAGGLLSPYTPKLTCADLAAALSLPVLLVARDGLGTINHSALALRELAARGLEVAALILVRTRPDPGTAAQRNAELIASVAGTRPIATVPYIRRPTPNAVADFLSTQPAVKRLLRRLT